MHIFKRFANQISEVNNTFCSKNLELQEYWKIFAYKPNRFDDGFDFIKGILTLWGPLKYVLKAELPIDKHIRFL